MISTSYTWVSMTNAQTAILIRDAVGMDYGCDGLTLVQKMNLNLL